MTTREKTKKTELRDKCRAWWRESGCLPTTVAMSEALGTNRTYVRQLLLILRAEGFLQQPFERGPYIVSALHANSATCDSTETALPESVASSLVVALDRLQDVLLHAAELTKPREEKQRQHAPTPPTVHVTPIATYVQLYPTGAT